MVKLSDTQLVILAAAAKRNDGSILPLPKRLKADKESAAQILGNLVKKKLAAELPASRDAAVWRRREGGERLMLAITEAGFRAIGIDPGGVEKTKESAADKKKQRSLPKKAPRAPENEQRCARENNGKPGSPPIDVRPDTKQARIVTLLRQPDGADIAQMMKATDWQAHSVRGFISGALKKKLGLGIVSEKSEDRGRIYRIVDHA
jgi:hypothetical protein